MFISHESFSERRPFSKSLELAFLSSKLIGSFLRFPTITDNDRRLFAKGADFFSEALKGAEAVRTLRVSSTAATEARTYGWGISVFSYLEHRNGTKEKKDIPTVFRDFKSTLEALQKPVSLREEKEQLAESVENLKQFFICMREVVKELDIEPIDKVLIRG